MPACLTRYASTMWALLTSARTDSSMTVKAKLFINAEPGFIVRGRIREFIRTWPHLGLLVGASRALDERDRGGLRWALVDERDW